MANFLTNQQPEVVFASVCGPGAAVQSRDLPVYLYVVYTFPAYMYQGFPECVPKANAKTIAALIENKMVPKTFRDYVTDMFLMRDDEFLKAVWRGGLWPITSLFSPVYESFTEAGNFIHGQRDKFVTKEAVRGWIEMGIDPDSENAIENATAWTYGEKACSKKFDSILTIKEHDNVSQRLVNDVVRKEDNKRILKLYGDVKDSLPGRMKKDDLNEILVNVRGLS